MKRRERKKGKPYFGGAESGTMMNAPVDEERCYVKGDGDLAPGVAYGNLVLEQVQKSCPTLSVGIGGGRGELKFLVPEEYEDMDPGRRI